MGEVDRNSPAFLKYYAGVLLREARARRGQPGIQWMIDGAARARRQAMATRPAQGVLFAAPNQKGPDNAQ